MFPNLDNLNSIVMLINDNDEDSNYMNLIDVLQIVSKHFVDFFSREHVLCFT